MIDALTLIMSCGLYADNATVNAMLMIGSNNRPLTVTTTLATGQRQVRNDFKTTKEAAAYAKAQMAQGYEVRVGLLQLPSRWVPEVEAQGTLLSELFESCKNVVSSTTILNQSVEACARLPDQRNLRACALSMYDTGSPTAGLKYAQQIIRYAIAHPMENNPQNIPLAEQANDQTTGHLLILPVPQFNTTPVAPVVPVVKKPPVKAASTAVPAPVLIQSKPSTLPPAVVVTPVPPSPSFIAPATPPASALATPAPKEEERAVISPPTSSVSNDDADSMESWAD